MKIRKFEDSLPLQLLKAREAAMQFFRPLLLKNKITEQQWRVLRALKAYEELESKQLAEHCCILSPSLTGIIKRLELQGYIKSRTSEKDQRRTLISLSTQALDLFEQFNIDVDTQYKVLTHKFGEEKLQLLSTLLDDLAELKR
jgi:homoprotocatechuate degradation regulator HpaR